MKNSAAKPRRFLDDQADSIFGWVQEHMRAVGIAAAAIVVIAAGAWMYARSAQLKEQRAGETLARAAQSADAGNDALAQSDLEKLIRQYSGTNAARQATLILAEVLYRQGKYQKGIDELQRLTVPASDRDLASAVEAEIAAGYEELRKFGAAADHYKKAAEKSRFEADRQAHLASAARAATSAGNTAEAKRIWSQLAANPQSAIAAEARVRLGELEAQPARRG